MNEEKDIFRNFKGIWIPKEIYLDERLSWTERILIGEIESLDNENGCFASNAYFSKFLRVSERTISESISKLKELNYISLDCFDGRKRKLKCNFKYRRDSDQNKTSILSGDSETKKVEEKFYHNNTGINKDKQTNTNTGGGDVVNNIPENVYGKRKNIKKEFIPPTKEELVKYCKEECSEYSIDGEYIYKYYSSNNWCDRNNKPVLNWKLKIISVWCTDERKVQPPKPKWKSAPDRGGIYET